MQREARHWHPLPLVSDSSYEDVVSSPDEHANAIISMTQESFLRRQRIRAKIEDIASSSEELEFYARACLANIALPSSPGTQLVSIDTLPSATVILDSLPAHLLERAERILAKLATIITE